MLRKLQMLGKKRCKKRIKFVDLEKCFKISLQLQNSALSQPKTDLPKFTRDRNLRQSLTPCWTIIVLNVCNIHFAAFFAIYKICRCCTALDSKIYTVGEKTTKWSDSRTLAICYRSPEVCQNLIKSYEMYRN